MEHVCGAVPEQRLALPSALLQILCPSPCNNQVFLEVGIRVDRLETKLTQCKTTTQGSPRPRFPGGGWRGFPNGARLIGGTGSAPLEGNWTR